MESAFTTLLFNSLHCGIIVIDAETNTIVNMNDSACNILHIDKSMIGSNCNKLLCSEMEECQFKQEKQIKFPEETCFMTKLQKRKWLLRNAVKINHDNKDYIIECFSDITKQKNLEQNYIDLVQYAPSGIYELDLTTYKHKHINQVMIEYTGYTEEEFDKVGILGLLTDKSKQIFLERMIRIKNGEEVPNTVEYEIVTKDGKHLWVLLNVRYLFNGDKIPHSAFCVVTNITERKCMELKILNEKDRAQMYLDMAFEIFVTLDLKGNITSINKTGSDILGSTEEHLIGLNWFETFVPEDDRQAAKNEFQETITGLNGEHIRTWSNFIITMRGEKRFIRWKNKPIKDKYGYIEGTFSSGDDITDDKKEEKELNNLWDKTQLEINTINPIIPFRRRSERDRNTKLDKAIHLVSNGDF
jgi:PAS domain S-box-containing protein